MNLDKYKALYDLLRELKQECREADDRVDIMAVEQIIFRLSTPLIADRIKRKDNAA